MNFETYTKLNGEPTIPMEQCKDGWLYLVHARNTCLGIYQESERGFVYLRHKFSSKFLDIEYHWDTGEPHGTCSPKKELGYYGNIDGCLQNNDRQITITEYFELKNKEYEL